MNRLRVGFAVTILVGTMFATASLLDSLVNFSVGLIVACCGLIGIGAIDYAQARQDWRDERTAMQRAAVWERRDTE